LGSWGDLSTQSYDFKLYTGDFMTPTVIAQSEDFTFSNWSDVNTNTAAIIYEPNEIFVVTATVVGEDVTPIEELEPTDFILFDAVGNKIDFDFAIGSSVDPMLPGYEYQLTPKTGTFNGYYRIRFAKTGYNPSNSMFNVGISSNATLSSAVIKGVTASLGTPNADLDLISAGSATLTSAQAGNGGLTSMFTADDGSATVKAVKYAKDASITDFVNDTAYADESISNEDFFIIKVTAEDNTVNYYRIDVTVTAGELSIVSVTVSNHTDAGGTLQVGDVLGVDSVVMSDGQPAAGRVKYFAVVQDTSDSIAGVSVLENSNSNTFTIPATYLDIRFKGGIYFRKYIDLVHAYLTAAEQLQGVGRGLLQSLTMTFQHFQQP
jgi:hypothetical protein